MDGEIKPCGLEPGPLMQCYFAFDTLFVEDRPEKRNALVWVARQRRSGIHTLRLVDECYGFSHKPRNCRYECDRRWRQTVADAAPSNRWAIKPGHRRGIDHGTLAAAHFSPLSMVPRVYRCLQWISRCPDFADRKSIAEHCNSSRTSPCSYRKCPSRKFSIDAVSMASPRWHCAHGIDSRKSMCPGGSSPWQPTSENTSTRRWVHGNVLRQYDRCSPRRSQLSHKFWILSQGSRVPTTCHKSHFYLNENPDLSILFIHEFIWLTGQINLGIPRWRFVSR